MQPFLSDLSKQLTEKAGKEVMLMTHFMRADRLLLQPAWAGISKGLWIRS